MTIVNDERRAADMDFSSFKMSDKQVLEFAKSIFADIESYVETHQEEYKKFLKKEKSLNIQDKQKGA